MASYYSEEIVGGQIKNGSTTYEMKEIKYGSDGELLHVWPLNLDYELVESSLAIVYSSGNQIAANAQNYAYVTGTIITKRGDVAIETATKTLTPLTWTNTYFFKRIIVDEVTTNNMTGVDHDPVNYPGYGMADQPFPNGIDCKITKVSYKNKNFDIASAYQPTIHQSSNTATETGTQNITTAYTWSLSTSQFNSFGGTVTISGTKTYDIKRFYHWTSGVNTNSIKDVDKNKTASQAPSSLTVGPTPSQIYDNNTKIDFAANNTGSNIVYQVDASYDGFGDTKVVTVKTAVYTYYELAISSYYYDYIPASGTTVGHPAYAEDIVFTVKYRRDGSNQGTLHGIISPGDSTGTASDQSHAVTVSAEYEYKDGSSWYTDSSNGAVTASSRGYNEDSAPTTATVNYPERRVTLSVGDTEDTDSTIVYQATNEKHPINPVFDSYEFYLDTDTASSAETVVGYYGYAYYDVEYWWDSGEPNTYGVLDQYQYPTTVTQTDSSGVSAQIDTTNHQITLPENLGADDIEFEFTGSFNGDSDVATITQSASTQYNYDTPEVYVTYEEIGPAAHTVHPRIDVWQDVYIGNDLYDTLYGYIDDGSTSGVLEGTLLPDSSFSLSSFTGSAVSGTGAAFNSTNGNVTTASRGTTENPDPRNVATNVSVTVEANSMSGTSSSVTVTQAANNKTHVDPVASAVRIVSLSTYDIDDTCLDTAVTATVRATWVGEGYVFDAYENGAGDPNARTGFVPHSDEFVTGDDGVTMRVNGTDDYSNSTNQFYVENKYNTSQATHSVVAMFWGATSSAAYVTQAADELSDWILGNYIVSVAIGSNTVSASGGQATIVASGSHDRYRTWEDGTIQSSSSVPDTPTLSLVDISEEDVFWIESTTLKHRNMAENGTTDYVTVRATNGSVTADSNTVSATNTCTYGNVTFNAPGSTADPGGDSINLNPTCPFSWTSGSSGTMMGDGFDFEYVVKANDTYRTYGFTGHYADFGSLGTNTRSLGNTTIRAILKADSSKTDTAVIQEEPNGPTNTHQLLISWSNPVTIPGYGGSINVGISSARYRTQYDSGDWDGGSDLDRNTLANIAASIQISGSGFTKDYTSGNTYVSISAPANSDYSSSRDCTLTAYYGGESDSTTVTQKNRPYRKELKTASGYRNMWLYNTDTESHDYTFTLEKTENGVHTSTPGQVAAGLAAGTGRIVAGVSSSPSSNDVDIDVTYVDNHEVITS